MIDRQTIHDARNQMEVVRGTLEQAARVAWRKKIAAEMAQEFSDDATDNDKALHLVMLANEEIALLASDAHAMNRTPLGIMEYEARRTVASKVAHNAGKIVRGKWML